MNESILNSVKKGLGPSLIYNEFDADIIMHINTVLRILNQLGVGIKGFYITDNTAKWNDFIPENSDNFHDAITYTICKVRLMFDPPTNSFLVTNLEKLCSELEWRLNVEADPGEMP